MSKKVAVTAALLCVGLAACTPEATSPMGSTGTAVAPVTVARHAKPHPSRDANGTGAVGSGAACNPGWVCGTCPPGTRNAGTEWGYDPVLSRQLGIPEGVDCNARP